MATMSSLGTTSNSNSDDKMLVSQGGVDYTQTRLILAQGLLPFNAQAYTDSGSANAYILTPDNGDAPTLFDMMVINFIPDNTSTGASTANVDGNGAISIVNSSLEAVTTEITASKYTSMYYDLSNTRWVLIEYGESTSSSSVTGSATFTNSTNNIALTGVGSLTDLEVGDILLISDSTSNDGKYTVETITDSGNVIVNAEHAGGSTTKSLTDESSTSGVTIELLVKNYSVGIGIGQGWCEPTRALSTTYTNDTGRSITVNFYNGSSGESGNLYVEDIIVAKSDTEEGVTASGSAIVPPDSEYYITGTTPERWAELR